MTLRAIIFDFDGLIADTETPVLRAWQELYASLGHEVPIEEWMKVIGTWEAVFDPYADLEARVGGPVDWEELERVRRSRESELVSAERLLPGVREHIEAADSAGLELAIASSSSRSWVERNLRRLGVHRYFRCVLTRDDVENTKPHPDLYRAAIDCLGVEGSEAVALEDSRHGVLAAVAAGVPVVAVPTDLTRTLDMSAADLVVGSLADIAPRDLWGRFGWRADDGG